MAWRERDSLTKTDKLSKSVLSKNIENYKAEMLKKWEKLPQTFFSSVLHKKGNKEILEFINSINELFIA